MEKKADFKFNISSMSPQYAGSSNVRFSTQDEGSAILTFFLYKDGAALPLKGVTGKIALKMADGSKFVDTLSIIDVDKGIAEYKLTPEQIKHFGVVVSELYLNYDNGPKMSVHQFSFTIEQALIDSDLRMLTEFYIDDFESLKNAIASMADETKEVITSVGTNIDQAKEIAEETISLIEQQQVVKRNDEGIFNFNIFNEETRRILQGLSPGQINAVLGYWNVINDNIKRQTIDPTKLAGSNVVNVFNPGTSTDGYFLGGTDSTADLEQDIKTADSNWVISDYIQAKAGESFTVDATSTANSVIARIYDKDKKPIRNIRNTTAWVGTTVTITDTNAAYIRFNIPVDAKPKTEKMIAVGTNYPTSFVPYMQTVLDWLTFKAKSINLSVLADEVIAEINKTVKADKIEGTTAVTPSANLLNPATVTAGKRLAKSATFPSGGEIFVADGNWGYGDFIPASPGDVFSCKGGYSAGAVIAMIYDSNKKTIDAITETTSWVTPRTITLPTNANIAYVRFNLNLQNTSAGALMIVKGITYPAEYIAYTGNLKTIDWFAVKPQSITRAELATDVKNPLDNAAKEIRRFVTPRKFYARTDSADTLRVFYRGIVSAADLRNLLYKSTYLDGIAKVREDHFTFSKQTTAGVRADTIYMYDPKTGVLIDSKVVSLVWSDPTTKSNPTSSKNILYFGDSFTQAGVYPTEMNDYLVVQKGWTNYKFIGQKTNDDGIKHQGMGGYAIHDFVIPPEQMRANFNINPFYNPTTKKLDFKYYMSNNGFEGDIDFMFLGHGVNDLLTYGRTPDQIVADIKTFIDQLHVDYPNCKVLMSGLVPLSPLNDMYDAYLHNNKVLDVNKAYDDFAAGSSYSSFVTYVPVCAEFNVDYAYEYEMKAAYKYSNELIKVLKDWLHPYKPGYAMIANQQKSAFLSVI